MSRYIDIEANREDFVERLYDILSAEPDNIKANLIIDAFDDIPTFDTMWKKCSECLPEKSDWYLVVPDDGAVSVMEFDTNIDSDNRWGYNQHYFNPETFRYTGSKFIPAESENILYWMPIPEIPDEIMESNDE